VESSPEVQLGVVYVQKGGHVGAALCIVLEVEEVGGLGMHPVAHGHGELVLGHARQLDRGAHVELLPSGGHHSMAEAGGKVALLGRERDGLFVEDIGGEDALGVLLVLLALALNELLHHGVLVLALDVIPEHVLLHLFAALGALEHLLGARLEVNLQLAPLDTDTASVGALYLDVAHQLLEAHVGLEASRQLQIAAGAFLLVEAAETLLAEDGAALLAI